MRDYISILFVCPFTIHRNGGRVREKSPNSMSVYMLIEQTSQSFMIYISWWKNIENFFLAFSWKKIHHTDDWSASLCFIFRTRKKIRGKTCCWQNISFRLFCSFNFRYQHLFSTARNDRTLRRRHQRERFAQSDEWDRLLIW